MSYMAFGEGPRKCIGQRFALLEAKLALFFLLRSFKLSLAPKTSHPIKYRNKGISLAPENDAVWIIPEARNWIKNRLFYCVVSVFFVGPRKGDHLVLANRLQPCCICLFRHSTAWRMLLHASVMRLFSVLNTPYANALDYQAHYNSIPLDCDGKKIRCIQNSSMTSLLILRF